MKTPERSVDEIVDSIDNIVEKQTGQFLTGESEVKVRELLQTERQKREEAVYAERRLLCDTLRNKMIEKEDGKLTWAEILITFNTTTALTQPNNPK